MTFGLMKFGKAIFFAFSEFFFHFAENCMCVICALFFKMNFEKHARHCACFFLVGKMIVQNMHIVSYEIVLHCKK